MAQQAPPTLDDAIASGGQIKINDTDEAPPTLDAALAAGGKVDPRSGPENIEARRQASAQQAEQAAPWTEKPGLKTLATVPGFAAAGIEKGLGIDPMHPIQSATQENRRPVTDQEIQAGWRPSVSGFLEGLENLPGRLYQGASDWWSGAKGTAQAATEALGKGNLPEFAEKAGETYATVRPVAEAGLEAGAGALGAVAPTLKAGAGKTATALEQRVIRPRQVDYLDTKVPRDPTSGVPMEHPSTTLSRNVFKYDLGGTAQDTFLKSEQALAARHTALQNMLKMTPGNVVDLRKAVQDAKNQFFNSDAVVRTPPDDLAQAQKTFAAWEQKLDQLERLGRATGGKTDLSTANLFKQGVGDDGNWAFGQDTAESRGKTLVSNSMYPFVRQAIEDSAGQAGPAIKAVNQQISDIMPIRDSAMRRAPVEARNEMLSLSEQLLLGGALSGHPVALAGIGIRRALKSGTLANWLAGKAGIRGTSSYIPQPGDFPAVAPKAGAAESPRDAAGQVIPDTSKMGPLLPGTTVKNPSFTPGEEKALPAGEKESVRDASGQIVPGFTRDPGTGAIVQTETPTTTSGPVKALPAAGAGVTGTTDVTKSAQERAAAPAPPQTVAGPSEQSTMGRASEPARRSGAPAEPIKLPEEMPPAGPTPQEAATKTAAETQTPDPILIASQLARQFPNLPHEAIARMAKAALEEDIKKTGEEFQRGGPLAKLAEKPIETGTSPVPLTDKGEQMAVSDAGKAENIQKLVTSDTKRSRDHGAIIGQQLGLQPETRHELSSWAHQLDGMPKDEAEARKADLVANPDKTLPQNPSADHPPESANQFMQRVNQAATALKSEPDGTLHVSNSSFMRALDSALRNGQVDPKDLTNSPLPKGKPFYKMEDRGLVPTTDTKAPGKYFVEHGETEDGPPNLRSNVPGQRVETNRAKTGQAFEKFFTDVTHGEFGKSNVPFNYELPMEQHKAFDAEYGKHRGNFDEHIRKSIPTYAEAQVKEGDAVLKTFKSGGNVLDIAGSEGGWAKTISSLSGGKIKTTVLDPNQAMKAFFDSKSQVPGATYDDRAFLAGFEGDDGKTVPAFDTKDRFNVINEGMGFQFISPDRDAQIAEVKRLLKPDGIFITKEKVKTSPAEWKENEQFKDQNHKNKYYTDEELRQKDTRVGFQQSKQEEKAVGMTDNMATADDFENTLQKNFKYVVQHWDSGNFKGYVASDSSAELQDFVQNLGDVNSKYSTVDTPRPVSSKPPEITGITEDQRLHEPFEKAPLGLAKRGQPGAVQAEGNAPDFEERGGKIYVSRKGLDQVNKSFGASIEGATFEGKALNDLVAKARSPELNDAVTAMRDKYGAATPVAFVPRPGTPIRRSLLKSTPTTLEETKETVRHEETHRKMMTAAGFKPGIFESRLRNNPEVADALDTAYNSLAKRGYKRSPLPKENVMPWELPAHLIAGQNLDLSPEDNVKLASAVADELERQIGTDKTLDIFTQAHPKLKGVADGIRTRTGADRGGKELGGVSGAPETGRQAGSGQVAPGQGLAKIPEQTKAQLAITERGAGGIEKEADALYDELTKKGAKQNLIAAAERGGIAKYWYRNSKEAFDRRFGDDAPIVVKLTGALSTGTAPKSNLRMALNAYNEWTQAGRPTDQAGVESVLHKVEEIGGPAYAGRWNNASRILMGADDIHNVDMSDRSLKVRSFWRNLAGQYDLATLDRHMATLMNLPQKLFATKSGYFASQRVVQDAAKEMGMDPDQVQSTSWTFIKPLKEMVQEGMPAEMALEGAPPAAKKDLLDFSTLMKNDPEIRGILDDIYKQKGSSLAEHEQQFGETKTKYGSQKEASTPFTEEFPKQFEEHIREEQKSKRPLSLGKRAEPAPEGSWAERAAAQKFGTLVNPAEMSQKGFIDEEGNGLSIADIHENVLENMGSPISAKELNTAPTYEEGLAPHLAKDKLIRVQINHTRKAPSIAFQVESKPSLTQFDAMKAVVENPRHKNLDIYFTFGGAGKRTTGQTMSPEEFYNKLNDTYDLGLKGGDLKQISKLMNKSKGMRKQYEQREQTA